MSDSWFQQGHRVSHRRVRVLGLDGRLCTVSSPAVFIYAAGFGIHAFGIGWSDPADYGTVGIRQKYYFAAWKNIRTTVGISVAGLLILVSQLTFMLAVAASNAGTAAIVLTLVPLICAFWLSITEKRPLTMREGICFVLAASGVFLIVTKGNFSTLDLSFAGVLWGFVSAIFSAAYSIQPRKLIMKVGVGPVVGFGMLFGGLVASVMNPPWTMNVQWTAMSVSAFTYVVLVGTVAAFWCYLSQS